MIEPSVSMTEFVELVRAMRKAQKDYFAKKGSIEEAKRLEREVDKALAEDPRQGKMF